MSTQEQEPPAPQRPDAAPAPSATADGDGPRPTESGNGAKSTKGAKSAAKPAAGPAPAAARPASGDAARPGADAPATGAKPSLPPLPPRPEPGQFARPVLPPTSGGPSAAPTSPSLAAAETADPGPPVPGYVTATSGPAGPIGQAPALAASPAAPPAWEPTHDLGWAGDGGRPTRRTADLSFEPELEGSSYQTAPITSLAIARWTWAVVGLLVGAVLGVLSASGGGYVATAQLQISDSNNSGGSSTAGTTYQALATSDAVLALAVKSLRTGAFAADYKRYGGALPPAGANGDDTAAKNYLAGGVKALWTSTTNLVSVSVTRPVGGVAIVEANAVSSAVQSKVQSDADAHIAKLSTEYTKLLSGRSVSASGNPADVAEVQAIAQQYGADKASAAFTEKQSVQVIGTTTAYPAGADQTISALLGAAGGAFLGALAAVAAGAGRRRPHSPRELVALAPDLVVRTTVQAGELAGRVMETDRRSVVVLAMPDTRFAATQLAMAVAHHLRTHGATVALVDRVTEFAPGAVSAEERLWALRRDVRRNIPANFSADLLVVVAGADEEALSLIAGQSDLLVAVVAKQRRSTLADIRRTVDAVQVSEPVVVLAR